MAFKGRELTTAIVALLRTNGMTVGSGERPNDSPVGWQGAPGSSVFIPYTVVYAITGGVFDGSMGSSYNYARPDYIISSYGASQDQAQWGDDKVFEILTTQKPTVANFVIVQIEPDVHGGAQRDDDVQPPLWWAPTRWKFNLSPTP